MAVNDIVMGAAGASGPATYIEDVFSTWLYTGNGSTQTITNGIDLSGKGGMTWLKSRSRAGTNHFVCDTSRGNGKIIFPNLTAGTSNWTGYFSLGSSGFTVASDGTIYSPNTSGDTYASWTFREQPKFFDVVTYTGNGSNEPTLIPHNLGSVPGFVLCKATSATGNWAVFHRGNGSTMWTGMSLNSTAAGLSYTPLGNPPTATNIDVTGFFDSTFAYPNVNGVQYVAYLFAHNAGGFGLSGTENVISCGSYTGTGSAGNTITLGYEPQFVIFKNASGAGDWKIYDVMRGLPAPTSQASRLEANSSGAEYNLIYSFAPTATGLVSTASTQEINNNGVTYIYIAIRRGPMAVPTLGTSVFNPAFFGTNGVSGYLGAPADMNIQTHRNTSYSFNPVTRSRLVGGGNRLTTSNTDAEVPDATNFWSNMTGTNPAGETQSLDSTIIDWTFRRAAGFFDVVCYTGTGVARTVNHNLTVAPELMIVKSRSSTTAWYVYNAAKPTFYLMLQSTNSESNAFNIWNGSANSTTFSLGNVGSTVNDNATTYVAYLFATVAGVSKVGSYTGTGATLNINAGFTTGARFVMIKRTDSFGYWFVWDTARGMVAGTDPRLAFNSTIAELNNNWVYTASSGFQIVTTDASVNASGGTYIYLAIA